LRDLRAYTCTFQDCSTNLFEDRNSWFRHECEHHRREWVCQSCTHWSRVYSSAAALQDHLLKSHSSSVNSKTLPLVISASSRPLSEVPAVSACLLCDDWQADLARDLTSTIRNSLVPMIAIGDIETHLARHLEEIALFSIPPGAGETANSGSQRGKDEPVRSAVPQHEVSAVFRSTAWTDLRCTISSVPRSIVRRPTDNVLGNTTMAA